MSANPYADRTDLLTVSANLRQCIRILTRLGRRGWALALNVVADAVDGELKMPINGQTVSPNWREWEHEDERHG